MSDEFEVPLSISSINHLEVIGQVNGINTRFMVDTGFSGFLAIDQGSGDKFKFVAGTTSAKWFFPGNKSEDLLIGELPELVLTSFVLRKIPTILLDMRYINDGLRHADLPHIDGIIGSTFLYHYSATINYDNMKMILSTKNRQESIGGA